MLQRFGQLQKGGPLEQVALPDQTRKNSLTTFKSWRSQIAGLIAPSTEAAGRGQQNLMYLCIAYYVKVP